MMSSSEIVLFSLLVIYIFNGWLEQKLEDAHPIVRRIAKAVSVKPHDSTASEPATIEEVDASPPSRMSATDMKQALQQYLNDHLQQHTPSEPTLESHYSVEAGSSSDGQVSEKKTPVYGLEQWGSDIQPFQLNASTFATI